ncbi:CDP-alcohol phosphatidyltransferase [Rhizobiales bacterium GAS191]|nr:CDP-alcohol phosphatidyltransferase [Rhizobiales bacterium GAS188]SED14991.1 CDP-alcohol phosphatidyltransferase [Rhizobiales bacterium GAS191]
MIGDSWTHLLARQLVRPLVGTAVTPNHLTTLRLLSGLAACACFALGTSAGMAWGGAIWLVSALLDRADGELARIGNMMSEAGHRYDYYTDVLVNTAFFVAIGVGLRHTWLGDWSIPLGLLAGGALLLCMWWSELLERRSEPNTRAYEGRWGFDPDDALYLMAPFAWLGWLEPVLVGAAAVAPVVAAVTGIRLLRLMSTPA